MPIWQAVAQRLRRRSAPSTLRAEPASGRIRSKAFVQPPHPVIRQQPLIGDAAPPIHVFRSNGDSGTIPYEGSAPEEGPKMGPAALTTVQLSAIGKALQFPQPGELYVRLSASTAGIPGKGALVFVRADIVEGGNNYAQFQTTWFDPVPSTTPEGYAVLWFWSPADRRYLIDFAVSGQYWHWSFWSGPEFRVAGPDAILSFDYRGKYQKDGYHLVFLTETSGTGWHSFVLYTAPAGEDQLTDWKLHQVEVTHM